MTRLRVLCGATCAALLPIVGGCGDDPIDPNDTAVASVTITPEGPDTLEVGEQRTIGVTLRNAAGQILVDRPVTISSTDENVVKFFVEFVEAVGVGEAGIVASSEGRADTLEITVTEPAVASISIAPARSDLWPAEQEQLVAVARDRRGNTLPDREVTWSSADPAVATVDTAGRVTGVAPGLVGITATSDGVSETAEITVQTPVSYVTVATATEHTCAVTTADAGYCWGDGDVGQLGVGTIGDRDSPARISGGFTWQSLAGATEFGCGATTGETAYCWGTDFRHRLGNDTVSNLCDGEPCRTEPTRAVIGGFSFTQVVTGLRHGCGLDPDGKALCWGDNASQQIGNDTALFEECGFGNAAVQCTEQPIPVQGDLAFARLTAGATHTCGLTALGEAYCWGGGFSGQLGNGASGNRGFPVAVTGGITFVALSAGSNHTCGVADDGTGYCWGSNAAGQLGTGAGSTNEPAPVADGITFAQIGGGGSHSCGVSTDGIGYCWGQGADGQLGTGESTGIEPTPVPVAGGLGFATMAVGGRHSCGVTTAGAIYCWGANDRGQLGIGVTETLVQTPTRVLGQVP